MAWVYKRVEIGGGGWASEVLPLQKGGTEKVSTLQKRGGGGGCAKCFVLSWWWWWGGGGANSFEPAIFPFGSPPPLPVIMTGPNIGITLKEIFLDEHFLTSHMTVPHATRAPLCRRPRFGEEPRPDSTDPDWSPTADHSQSSALRVQH